ncbi:MAG: Ig-like domain-containing protein, partial [Peptococcaceae bacterium]|nr:Ig-like domain-containing protein [Peptococcaceae bacterium]
DSVSADSIELIDTTSGERVECECYFVDSQVMQVMPREPLQANTEYWLVIHPELQDRAGRNISGGLAIAWTGAK